MKRRIIIIEEDEAPVEIPTVMPKLPTVPNTYGEWICPKCGKKVHSMEVHPCNLPYCSTTGGNYA